VIQQLASPLEIYHKPANQFVAGFIGSPSMNFVEGRVAGGPGGWRFEAAGESIDLSNYGFAGQPGERKAVFGIRPEHIDMGPGPAGTHTTNGTVGIVEPMGADTVLWTTLAGKSATIRVDGDNMVATGDEIGFHFDTARASLFDAETGERL
jgi:multiple sugar transport system ATP-binding protein